MNAIDSITTDAPRWVIMWLLAAAVFYLGKTVMWILRPTRGERWPLWKTLAWWFAWPGMSTHGWTGGRGVSAHREGEEESLWIRGTRNMLLGACLLWGLVRHTESDLLAGWVGMVGFILLFHFGLFHLVAAFWRTVGFPVKPVMRRPLAATSLAEFWGKRWNTAFRDLSHRALFMPVARRWGEAGTLWCVFLVSGLVHELVITVPAGGGYGLPTVYFLLQATGLIVERRYCTLSPAIRRVRTILFTVLPVFILFPPPFVERVMVPFFNAVGALP